jgi:hypothetical protein
MLISTPEPCERNRFSAAGPVHLTHQVGLDDLAEDLGGNLLERPVGDRAGVIDPDVEPPEALDRRGSKRLDGLLVGDVERSL